MKKCSGYNNNNNYATFSLVSMIVDEDGCNTLSSFLFPHFQYLDLFNLTLSPPFNCNGGNNC